MFFFFGHSVLWAVNGPKLELLVKWVLSLTPMPSWRMKGICNTQKRCGFKMSQLVICHTRFKESCLIPMLFVCFFSYCFLHDFVYTDIPILPCPEVERLTIPLFWAFWVSIWHELSHWLGVWQRHSWSKLWNWGCAKTSFLKIARKLPLWLLDKPWSIVDYTRNWWLNSFGQAPQTQALHVDLTVMA